MELLFTSIKDAIRLKLYLTANGLRETLVKSQDQFMYTFQVDQRKRSRYEQALITFIKDVKRNEWLNNTLQHKFHYENEDERSHIIEIATQMFSGARHDLSELAGVIDESGLIKEAVSDLLSFGGAVSFESFSRFRLKPYYERVEKYLEIAIDEYKMEQEYQTFVQMLRDYLRNRATRMEVIHLLLNQTPKFYDEHLHELSSDEIKEMMDQRLLANHPIYVDSAVIAPLLSIAAIKVYVYTDKADQPLIRTLSNIFEERISVLTPVHFSILKKAYVNKP
ncbi:putative sporulation protein YtxC [Bacillus sp. FJAT-50079]|uniref:putative sporulation protein YtxC n=1 Tax=Bacillus sp. FJAT-50079 TaxID=2833577 RepID=UPI001BC9B897|nr:putative sporulation protein YtxC [Bacillus sp. FJAT-50079]MBS4208804.1 putative sporulation protein YtxC [Bacillus sp. FJAT-50079]